MNVRYSLAAIFTASLIIIAGPARAADNDLIVFKPFDNVALATGGSNISAAIDMGGIKASRTEYSMHLTVTNYITNSGAVTVSYECSNDGVFWPYQSNIAAGVATTNAAVGSGRWLASFTPPLAKFIRFKILVTGTNADVTGIAVIQ